MKETTKLKREIKRLKIQMAEICMRIIDNCNTDYFDDLDIEKLIGVEWIERETYGKRF